MRRSLALLIAVVVLGAPGATAASAKDRRAIPPHRGFVTEGTGDATVVAVLDFGFVPYHWDFLASNMPQHTDSSRADDLPLDVAPHNWLPGFPDPAKEFTSYSPLKLSLEEKRSDESVEILKAADQKKWDKVKSSTPKKRHVYWIPGTKVIGAMTFDRNGEIVGTPRSHGTGTTSSAVGNLHGTCPECLLFFIELGGIKRSEKAIEWAMSQPWIDAISNSYGYSLAVRDRIYSGSNVKAQRAASERGQTIFFSAGNGQEGGFVVPNTTSFSSQEGPDWIVTVGAVSPGEDNYYYREESPFNAIDETSHHASYSGHGKPADVAGIGANYPSAYSSNTVGGTGSTGFSGTSNATPQVVGTYARALYMARRALSGPSTTQSRGVVAVGRTYNCGAARPDCELRDGALTASELRTRLFHGARHTSAGITPAGAGELPAVGEEEFLNEGHGSYFGRETGRWGDYAKEFDRIFGPLTGRAKALKRPQGEREWMIVDSFCRQHLWGAWRGGYFLDTKKTPLPDNTPDWPLRTLIKEACPRAQRPV